MLLAIGKGVKLIKKNHDYIQIQVGNTLSCKMQLQHQSYPTMITS